MFSLTIVFGPGPMVWTLLFKDREKAISVLTNRPSAEIFSGVDDFGQEFYIKEEQIHGTMLENLDQSKFAHIERALHQARTKIAADKLAEADPTIREAARRQQGGMPMIQPMNPGLMTPNGGFRG